MGWEWFSRHGTPCGLGLQLFVFKPVQFLNPVPSIILVGRMINIWEWMECPKVDKTQIQLFCGPYLQHHGHKNSIFFCLMHCPQTALSLDLKACTKGDFVMPTGRSHQSSFLPENRLYFLFELSCLSFPDIVFVQVFTTRLIRPVITAIFSLWSCHTL